MKMEKEKYFISTFFSLLILCWIFDSYWNIIDEMGIFLCFGLFCLFLVTLSHYTIYKKETLKLILSFIVLISIWGNSISLWSSDHYPIDFLVGIAIMYTAGISFMIYFMELTGIEPKLEKKSEIILMILPLIFILVVCFLDKI